MIGRRHLAIGAVFAGFAFSTVGLRAQEGLSLTQAVEAAVAGNPDIVGSRAATQEAEQRMSQARAGFLPRVDFTQSWQRGDQPVFVFGSLLGQRQFSAADFALGQLNHPEPLTNRRTAFWAEQMLFDGGQTRAETRSASNAAAVARAAERQTHHDLILSTTRAYGQALRAVAQHRASESARAGAEEVVRTAQARRDAGTGTEADLLAMRVHLAQMQAREIESGSSARIARADLNRLMQVPLDREFTLEEPIAAEDPTQEVGVLVQQALRLRPEIEQAKLRREGSHLARDGAQGGLWPQVAVQGGYEWNDGARGAAAGAWIVGAHLRMNLFSGGANTARVREASYAAERAQAEFSRTEAALRMEVLTAYEQLSAAKARAAVGRAMVVESRESQRMIRDRYEAGMVPVRDVIQAVTTVLDAEAQRIGAVIDIIVGQAALRRAIGGEEVQP